MPRGGAEYQAILAEVKQTMGEQPEQVAETPTVVTDEVIEPEVTEPEAVQEPEAQEEEGLRSLNEVPEYLGISPEDFYSLPISLSDGEEPKTLGQIKDEAQSLKTEKQSLEQQRAQLAQQAQAIQQQALQMRQGQSATTERMAKAKQQKDVLEAQYQQLDAAAQANPDQYDPGQLALAKQNIAQQHATATAELTAAEQEANQQQQAAMHQVMAQEYQRIASIIPEWTDPVARQKKSEEIANLAISKYGARPEEVRGILGSSRTVAMLNDLADYHKIKAGADEAVAKVKKKAPVVPRSARRAASQAKQAHVAELEQRALQTGKQQDRKAAARAIWESANVNLDRHGRR